jgi:uncharacterized protein with PIN domain
MSGGININLEDNPRFVVDINAGNRVPHYVCRTQSEYVECPNCHHIYWQGTHWQAMVKKLQGLVNS